MTALGVSNDRRFGVVSAPAGVRNVRHVSLIDGSGGVVAVTLMAAEAAAVVAEALRSQATLVRRAVKERFGT